MKWPKRSGITRREWLKALAGLGSGAVLSGCTTQRRDSATRIERAAGKKGNLVQQENERPGTHEWLLTNPRIDPASKYRCPWIEGYCSHPSVRAGESLSLFVSMAPASDFSVEIYRMGFYGGAGGRLVS